MIVLLNIRIFTDVILFLFNYANPACAKTVRHLKVCSLELKIRCKEE